MPHLRGTAVHNHWESYQSFENCEHAFCNGHHLRGLVRAIEQADVHWAKAMKDLLLDIKTTVDTAKDEGKLALAASQIDDLNRQYREIVNLGLAPYLTEPRANAPAKRRRKKQSKTKDLLHRFDKYQTETLRFMNHFRLPFDNNQAERHIRMTQVKQKISGTFRSANGTP